MLIWMSKLLAPARFCFQERICRPFLLFYVKRSETWSGTSSYWRGSDVGHNYTHCW